MNILKYEGPHPWQISRDQHDVLLFYKKMYSYSCVHIFPEISSDILQPAFSLGGQNPAPFKGAKAIDWLNYYHKIFSRDMLTGNSTIDRFFDFYKIDQIYPIWRQKECYGFLAIGNNGKKVSDLERHIAGLIVRYLASIRNNNNLLEDIRRGSQQTEQLVAEMSGLMEISQAIESGGNLQVILELIMQKCMQMMTVEAVSLLLMKSDGKKLEFRVALGPKGKDVKPFTVKVGQGIAGAVAESGQALLIPDAYADERFDPSFDQKSGFKTSNILCIPLKHRGKVIGVVQALNRYDGEPFNDDDLRLFTIFANQAALVIQNTRLLYRAIEQKKLESEIAIASEIQHLIVPEKLPQLYDFEVSGLYIPHQGVGGDFYSVVPVNDNEIIFCIADVSGKNVPGALLVSTLHATLKAYLEFSSDIQLIVHKLNLLIMQLSTADRFITLFLSKYNRTNGRLSYISAGHNPLYLVRADGSLEQIKSTGMCVGLIPFDYKLKELDIQPGDVLIFYTDGVVEARNPKNEQFGEERLEKVILENIGQPCTVIQYEISKSVRDFCEPKKPDDDFTMLIIRKRKVVS